MEVIKIIKLNYTLKSIRINSEWFDNLGRKKNIYQKIGYKGLYLYFKLYKFRLHGQENEHTFITSIAMLRKETKYTTDEIFNLLKKMKSAKIIKMDNCSRWDYLLDDGGNIKDKDALMITAIDTFPLSDYSKNDDKFYIYIPLELFATYEEKGLADKYFALYCLIKKWSQNVESKMWMSISKMSEFLGIDKDYVNKMIYQMNRNYFLSSYKKKNKNGDGYYFNHFILDSANDDKVDEFLKVHKSNMDKLIRRVDKKKKNKKATNIEQEMEVMEDSQEPPKKHYSKKKKLAFGVEGGSRKSVPRNGEVKIHNLSPEEEARQIF